MIYGAFQAGANFQSNLGQHRTVRCQMALDTRLLMPEFQTAQTNGLWTEQPFHQRCAETPGFLEGTEDR
jgi:hypothetical protein